MGIQPEVAGEELEVALDGTVLGLVPLKAGRQHLAFDVPAERQRTPRQRLRLRFPQVEEARSKRRAGPAVARLYDLVVGLADDPALAAIERRGSVFGEGGPGVLMQAAPSRARFALLRPESAELAVVPALPADAPAAAAVTVRVLVRDGRGERELWSRRLRAEARPREARVALPGATGEAFELVLAAEAPADRAAPFVAWAAPRVHGAAPAAPLRRPSARSRRRAGPRGAGRAARHLRRRAGAAVRLLRLRRTHAGGGPAGARGRGLRAPHHPAVYTTAAMSAVWSSQYPDAGQSEWLHDGKMPRERLTLAELLSAQGIETAGFIANPSAGPTVGLDRGFALFERLYREPWHKGSPPDAEIFRAAVHPWVRKSHGRFLLYAHWREPHTPYGPVISGPDAPLPSDAKWYAWWDAANSGRRSVSDAEKDHLVRLYDGNLAWADRELGRLRGELEKAGRWDRMAGIVTGDHGEALFEHGYTGHNVHSSTR